MYQDTSARVYELCNEDCKFCVHIIHQIWKKRIKWSLQGDSKEETVLEFEVSNTRSNIPPCIWVEYCESWDELKFWIKESTLTTRSGNIWSRLKSPTINILCCVGVSLINKIKSSIKQQRGPGMWYTITNKKRLLFYFKHNWQYLQDTKYFNYFNDVYTLLTLQHKAKPCCVVLWMSFQLSRISSICFVGLLFILVSVKQNRLE